MPTSFNILRGNTVTIANKPLTKGLMTIDTDKKKVSVDWDSNGTLERIGFSSGDVTANSNESGSNDLEGLSVGEKGYKVLPIDSDLVLDENDITLSDVIDNKADIDDYGVDLIAKRVMTNLTEPTKNTDPYVYRKTPTAKTDIVDMHKIIGASVVWNQLASAILISGTSDGITFTNNNDGSVSISGKATAQISRASYNTIAFKTNHIYFLKGGFNDTLTNYWLYANIYGHIADGKSQKISKSGTVIKLIDDYSAGLTIRVENNVEISGTQTAKPIVIDLTAMFGTTVADYVYSLEQSEVGTGIAWLQSYGFFTKDYYAYQTNKIESVCVSEKKIYGENLIAEPSTYPISPITLRGLFGVNNGKLTVDGDEYFANGNVTRNYEQRAYQSGDESLVNAITDGTNTVVALATPTTETTTPFVEIQSDNASVMGNPVTVNAERGIMQNAVVTFTPIQDLNGYDSPWVGGAGKNKAVFEDSFIVSSRNYTKTVDGNGIKVKSTGSNGRVGYSYPLEANTNYTVSFKLKKTNIDVTSRVYIATENDVWSGSASGFVASFEATTTETTKSQLVTTTSSSLIFIGVLAGSEGGEIIVTDLQIEVGNQATTYEPYSNICPISGRTQTTVSVNSEDTTIQFGQTVYGGEVKSQGGTDNKWKLLKKKLSDANKVETEGETYKRYRILIESEGIDTAKRTQTLCDKTSFVNSGGEYIHFNINSQGVYIYIYAPNDMATTEEFEFCIPLATPTTVNTPATSISLNKGSNTVTVDDNGTISFNYRMRDTFISTEEFVDYNVNQGNRDIAIPCGHDSDYYQYFDLPELPTDNNTYLLTCTVTNGEPNITWERS